MPVRIVARDPIAQPQHLFRTQMIRQELLDFARPIAGLRACTGLSRHSSVVNSSPCPLTSMLPPSSTASVYDGLRANQRRDRATRRLVAFDDSHTSPTR